jgi:hypothetical protein
LKKSIIRPFVLLLVTGAFPLPAAAGSLTWISAIECSSPHRLSLLPGGPVTDQGITLARRDPKGGPRAVVHLTSLSHPGEYIDLPAGSYVATVHHDIFGAFDLSLSWQPLGDLSQTYAFRILNDSHEPSPGFMEFRLFSRGNPPPWDYLELAPATCSPAARSIYDYRNRPDGTLRTP